MCRYPLKSTFSAIYLLLGLESNGDDNRISCCHRSLFFCTDMYTWVQEASVETIKIILNVLLKQVKQNIRSKLSAINLLLGLESNGNDNKTNSVLLLSWSLFCTDMSTWVSLITSSQEINWYKQMLWWFKNWYYLKI